MSKIIYKSVLKEVFLTFLATLAFLNSVLMMEKILRLSRLLSGVGSTFRDMSAMILYLQPQLLLLTIPMSLLLSTLLVYGRLDHDSELTILRASGMDFVRISRPVAVLGLICFFAGLAVSFYVGPRSSTKLRSLVARVISQGAPRAVEEGTFNTSFRDVVIFARDKKPPDTLEDIFIYDNRQKEEPRVLMAKSGRLFAESDAGIGIDLRDGYINLAKDKSVTELFFGRYRFTLSLNYDRGSPKRMELTPFQLLQRARSTTDEKDRRSLYLDFFRRLSLPAVCLILIFLGPPLSLISGKSGRPGGLAVGLLVFSLYYVMLLYFENLVMTGKMAFYVGAWMPSVVLGIFALFLFRREEMR